MSHTQGPWAVLERTAKRFDVKVIHPEIGTIATIHTPTSWDQGLSNARLIAEVPALRDLVAEILFPAAFPNQTHEQWRERAMACFSRIEVSR